jgi:hypothetical protein
MVAGIYVKEGDERARCGRLVHVIRDFPAPISSAPKRDEPPLLLWIPALSSWESGCWFQGSLAVLAEPRRHAFALALARAFKPAKSFTRLTGQ